MKKFLKILGGILILLIAVIGIYYFANNESLPEGEKGEKADQLAEKMMTAMNKEAFDQTEILQWSFRGKHHYIWKKQEDLVEVSWDDKRVTLNLKDPSKSTGGNTETIQEATNFFNNDSFWLIAPYKVFDEGVERRLVKYEDKDALLVTYTSGGSTPGDSYLWILNENGIPTSYKMWVSIIPMGGVSASWSDWKNTDSGIKLPTKHKLSILGMEIDMGDVKASNPKADELANKILKAVKHEAYKNTRYIDWSFGGRRFYKWDKEQHIVEVKWNDAKVILHPNDMKKSVVFLKDKEIKNGESLVKRAWDYFNNDSFWLVAPHKLFEPGILRSIEMIDGKEALRVKYTTGGTTPGDSYVWILDENYMPVSYKMYVPSMKMEGVPATWEEWIETESGTMLPKNHTFSSGNSLSMGDVKAYN
ncbi:hypothetical protein AAON49_03470 [Pseudotenacibaculum sp. MALMAid0570]|uniref:hypothetical protein n=1 Tax=Pseudotenacibaculum sp. MALMAid0570 TaxID=3143938 RepID=UPI0032DE67FC